MKKKKKGAGKTEGKGQAEPQAGEVFGAGVTMPLETPSPHIPFLVLALLALTASCWFPVWEEAQDASSTWVPATHTGDPDGVPGSCLQPALVLAVARMNQRMQDVFIFASCSIFSNTYIKYKYVYLKEKYNKRLFLSWVPRMSELSELPRTVLEFMLSR